MSSAGTGNEIPKDAGRFSIHAIATVKANVTGNLVPLLLTESPSGDVNPLHELLSLSVNMLEGSYGFDEVRALNATIGRYADLYASMLRWAPVDAQDLIRLTYLYADYRLNGSVDVDGNDLSGLGWTPVKWATFENDLRHLKTYSEWCSTEYGYLPLLPTIRIPAAPESLPVRAFQTLTTMAKASQRDFMVHLASRRRHWRDLLPQHHRPKISLRRQQKRRRGDDEQLEESFIHDLIEQERNPVYRALWIMAAWGGVRISEQLNQWVCDVLPGRHRPKFFPGDSDIDTPLVLLADPWESTWCGSYGSQKVTRLQFLKDRYGLVPRPDLGLPESSSQAKWVGHCGFKGMAFHNQGRLVSQVFWLDPSMAAEYGTLAEGMIDFHGSREISDRHPWLWIVTDRRKPDQIGNPIKMTSVNRAFERACARLGVKANEGGRSIHGLRHFYKSYADNVLGLGEDIVQILMHHRSRNSQHVYGWKDSVRIRDAISAGYQSIEQHRVLPPA